MDLKPRPPSDDAARPLEVWVVTDGRAGIENQALGLAEALGRQVPVRLSVKRVAWPRALRRVPSRLMPASPAILASGRETLTPPWPDIWIGNGRASIPLSIGVRRWSKGRAFVVQLQDPVRRPALFDLVIPPSHDRLKGHNVFPIIGTPHRVTPERLKTEAERFSTQLSSLPAPRIACLVGGKAKAYDLSPTRARALSDAIADAVRASGGSLLLTFSRRTPPEARRIMSERLGALPGWIWDETGENPFFAFLGAADAILVTEDSANMPAEAAASGKPVYLLPMDGGQPRRRRFHADLAERGVTRPFTGRIESWTYPPLDETDRAAREVLRRFAIKHHEMV